MKQIALIGLLSSLVSLAQGAVFYTPVGITSNTTNFFALTNLIQGPGTGFDAAAPHNGFAGSAGNSSTAWVTDAPGGFPSDYMTLNTPVIVLDMGSVLPLQEISTWGYNAGNANGVSAFSLRFSTTGTFSGAPVESFSANISEAVRDSHPFVNGVQNARYVEFTVTDNYYSGGGFGPPPGGDRVGLNEISFEAIPEPSTALLGGIALLGLMRRRRA